MASRSRPTIRPCRVTSIPNNAVYGYDLATLKVVGKVDLPSEKVAGNDTPLSAVPAWVTFTPDGKYLYVSNAGRNRCR